MNNMLVCNSSVSKKILRYSFSEAYCVYFISRSSKTLSVVEEQNISKMSVTDDALIWIDLEMDGLDLTKNYILEIACIVTDFDVTNSHEGIF